MVGCSLTFAKLEWRWCGFYLWCFQSWKDRERERQTVDAKLSWIQGPAAQSGKPSPSWGMLVAFLLFAFREAYHLRSRIFFVIPWKNWHVGQRSPTIFSKYPQLKLCLNYTFNFPNIYWQQKFSNLLIRFIPTWECPARTSWLELGEPDDVEKKKNEETKQFEKAPHKLTLSNQCSDC